VDSAWQWDPSLYEGSARYYSTGRMAYPAAVVQTLRSALELDGTGRLLDVGCGPGSLTVLLAPQFAEATGVDADPDMLVEAGRRAAAHGVDNITWRHLRAEALPGDLGLFRLVTFAQSFHWFDRPRVAAAVRTMLGPDGACVHVHATTHQGVDDDTALPHPRPPRAEIAGLVQRYLGSTRRAGQGVLPDGTPGGEGDVFQSAGFRGPQRLELTEAPQHGPGGCVDLLVVQLGAAPVRRPARRVRARPARNHPRRESRRRLFRANAVDRTRHLATVTCRADD
jgi:SAM-dependent methyltransferase